MKNKIAIASAFIAASSFSTAEIVINDFLSFEGFVDMSYTHTDNDKPDANENSFQVDQVEISWLFDFDPVTAQIDLQYEGDRVLTALDSDGDPADFESVIVEQAFATYHLDNGGAITAGRYASMLGFEAFEPTGLYQYSTAYTGGNALDQALNGGVDDDDSDFSVLPGYNQGVKFTYETDTTFFGLALLDGDYNRSRLGGDEPSNGGLDADGGYGIEAAGSFDLGNGVNFFLGGRYDDGDTADKMVYNTYVTYETGAWLFAAELAYSEEDFNGPNNDEEALNFLVMANFAYSEDASITGRLSYVDGEEETGVNTKDEASFLKYTLAHGYAFTDNLFLVTELSYLDGEASSTGVADTEFDELQAAVELIFSF